jgi:hypothetical protein
MSHRTHRITAESILNMRFSERLALEMITASLWPLAADERIGLLLTMLADNLCDVAETDEEIDAIVERLRLHIKLECHSRTSIDYAARCISVGSRMRSPMRRGSNKS